MKYHMRYIPSKLQRRKQGFSVAFGSTGCSGSAGGRALFEPLARTLSAGDTNSMPPWQICKIGLSKMQFPAFPGPELGKFADVRFLVDSKTTPIGKSVRIQA